jgi:hypothetical protein
VKPRLITVHNTAGQPLEMEHNLGEFMVLLPKMASFTENIHINAK